MPSDEPRSRNWGGAEDWLAKIGLPREEAGVSRAPHAPTGGPPPTPPKWVDPAIDAAYNDVWQLLMEAVRREEPQLERDAAGTPELPLGSLACFSSRKRKKRQSDRRYGIAASTPLFHP